MNLGTLSYDFGSERYEIAFDKGGARRDLHCGDPFEIQVHGKWIKTRIEYSWDKDDWYLVGVKDDDWSAGAKVRSY
jgi:hypothetical protein